MLPGVWQNPETVVRAIQVDPIIIAKASSSVESRCSDLVEKSPLYNFKSP